MYVHVYMYIHISIYNWYIDIHIYIHIYIYIFIFIYLFIYTKPHAHHKKGKWICYFGIATILCIQGWWNTSPKHQPSITSTWSAHLCPLELGTGHGWFSTIPSGIRLDHATLAFPTILPYHRTKLNKCGFIPSRGTVVHPFEVKRARFAGSLGRKSRRKHLISRAGQKGTPLVSDSLEPLNILLLIGYYSWFFSTYLICWVSISILVIFSYIYII
jgi:hypothetical protein